MPRKPALPPCDVHTWLNAGHQVPLPARAGHRDTHVVFDLDLCARCKQGRYRKVEGDLFDDYDVIDKSDKRWQFYTRALALQKTKPV